MHGLRGPPLLRLPPALLRHGLTPTLLLRPCASLLPGKTTKRLLLLLGPRPVLHRRRLLRPRLLWLRGGLLHWLLRGSRLRDGCTNRCGAYGTWEGGRLHGCFGACEFLDGHLSVAVRVRCGVKACRFFEVCAGGLGQLLDGQPARTVVVGEFKPLLQRQGPFFLGAEAGAEGTSEGIGRGGVHSTVVQGPLLNRTARFCCGRRKRHGSAAAGCGGGR